MSRIIGLLALLIVMSQTASATSVYELVVGTSNTVKMQNFLQNNTKLVSWKISGSVDFEGKQGTSVAGDTDFTFTSPPFWRDISFSHGPSAGFKDNDDATSWKAGWSARFEGPVFGPSISPYLRFSALYQDPGLKDQSGAAVGLSGLGLSFLLGESASGKKSALELEGTYQRASDDIYFDHTTPKDHDAGLSLGLKIFF